MYTCAIGDVAFSSYQFQTLSCSCGLLLEPAPMESFQLKNLNPAQLFQLLFITVLELAERFQINLRGQPRVFMREEPDEENPPEAFQPPPVPAHGPVRARRCHSACRFCVQGCDRTKPYHKHHACQGHAHLRIWTLNKVSLKYNRLQYLPIHAKFQPWTLQIFRELWSAEKKKGGRILEKVEKCWVEVGSLWENFERGCRVVTCFFLREVVVLWPGFTLRELWEILSCCDLVLLLRELWERLSCCNLVLLWENFERYCRVVTWFCFERTLREVVVL